jgi:hypothetical protein
VAAADNFGNPYVEDDLDIAPLVGVGLGMLVVSAEEVYAWREEEVVDDLAVEHCRAVVAADSHAVAGVLDMGVVRRMMFVESA